MLKAGHIFNAISSKNKTCFESAEIVKITEIVLAKDISELL